MKRTTERQRSWLLSRCAELVCLSVLALGIGPAALAQQPAARGRQGTDNTSVPGPRSPFDLTQGRSQKSLLPEMTHVPSDVRDNAGMFSAETVRRARESLETMEKSTGVAVLIETIMTLGGEPIDTVALRLARRSGLRGVFVLIAKQESKIEVLVSRSYSEAIPQPARHRVRDAFVEYFRRASFDDGLRHGIVALQTALATAKTEGKLLQAERPAPDGAPRAKAASENSPAHVTGDASAAARLSGDLGLGRTSGEHLVVRNQVRLTLEGARTIIAAAERKAASMNLKVNIAVVDDGGHLLSFDRVDGARPASAYTSLTKAITAATFRQPTGPSPTGTANPDPLLNLSLQNAALASGGKITTLYGGVPVVVDGQVIGGVGVGGGTGEQDAQVARAGIEVFLDRLKTQDRAVTGEKPRAESEF
jgi:glc operon protein GlcG